jgi:hypothetical protein
MQRPAKTEGSGEAAVDGRAIPTGAASKSDRRCRAARVVRREVCSRRRLNSSWNCVHGRPERGAADVALAASRVRAAVGLI